MDALTNELSEVKAAIKKVEGQIDRVEAELLATTDEKEKEYLREEKKSLREEKKSLREKENLLLRKMDFTPSEVPSSTPSMFFCLLSLIPDCSPCLISGCSFGGRYISTILGCHSHWQSSRQIDIGPSDRAEGMRRSLHSHCNCASFIDVVPQVQASGIERAFWEHSDGACRCGRLRCLVKCSRA
jgi:hypothetical protein